MAESPYRLEIASLDLGPDVRAVGLELIESETREPVVGAEAARIWAAILPALAGEEPWGLDFFSHLDRVREFCRNRAISYREPNARVLSIFKQPAEPLAAIFDRFAGETFGVRAGGQLADGDEAVESGLAQRGVDAYHTAFPHYFFCAVCDFENGFLTLLSDHLWASEVIRRSKAVLENMEVQVARPS